MRSCPLTGPHERQATDGSLRGFEYRKHVAEVLAARAVLQAKERK